MPHSAGRTAVALAISVLLGTWVGPFSPLAAQGGWRLEGRVTESGGAPIPSARVQVRGSGAQAYRLRTDSAGHFSLEVEAAEEVVVVSVQAQGFQPSTRTVARPALAATRVSVEFPLAARIVALDPVVVRARRLSVAEATRFVPGTSSETAVGLGLLDQPVNGELVGDLAREYAGVAELHGAGLSIGGQSPDETRYTTDGMEGSAIPLPREGVRSAAVFIDTYDVARGGFTGGQVDVRTQSATNEWGASVRGDGGHPWLQYGDGPPGARRRRESLRLDAGGGGAVVRDRVLVFGAVRSQRSEQPLLALEAMHPADLRHLGVSPDSVARLLVLTSGTRPSSRGGHPAVSSMASALMRLDAVLSPRHLLSVRVNGGERVTPDAGSAAAVGGTGAEVRGRDLATLVQLGSGGRSVANDLRVSFTDSELRTVPADPVPLGAVTVDSRRDDAAAGVATLRFAGSGFAGGEARERGVQIADELVVVPGSQPHRFRAGVDLRFREHRRAAFRDPGQFHFRSLEDLEAGRPFLFTRAASEPERALRSASAALFLDDHWRAPGGLQVNYGVRFERAVYSVDRVAGVPTAGAFAGTPGRIPSPWQVSPRVGFAFPLRLPWTSPDAQPVNLHGGFGDFVGTLPLASLSSALHQDGTMAAARLTCVGDAAPTPDWGGFRSGTTAVPELCADGDAAHGSLLPDVTIFSPGFVPSRVRRASLGSHGIVGGDLFYGVGAMVSYGRQPATFDRNLRAEPAFVLESEGGRFVHAPPDAIHPESGSASPAASRAHPEFGTVREVTGGGRSRTVQVTGFLGRWFQAAGRLRPLGRVTAQTGYTWTHAQETIGGVPGPGGFSTTTGADPRVQEWAPAGHSPRHMLFVSARTAPTNAVAFTVRARWQSGSRFTPLVLGDVNADGFGGDRAFVFDGADPRTEPAVAEGMARLLDELPPGAARCLRRQSGRIAAHNSCTAAAYADLDLTAQWKVGPRLGGSTRTRANVWVSAQNVTAGLDYLLHGSSGVRGWGQAAAVDPHLLVVRGFDADARAFRYAVNPAFARRSTHASVNRTPFQLRLQVRVTLGAEPTLRRYHDARDAGSNRRQAYSPENVRLHAARQLPNLPQQALALNGPRELGLTPAQALRLESAADSLGAPIDGVIDAVVQAVAEPDGVRRAPDFMRLDELARRADALRAAGLRVLLETLGPEQLARLPAELRRTDTRFSPQPPERVTLSAADL